MYEIVIPLNISRSFEWRNSKISLKCFSNEYKWVHFLWSSKMYSNLHFITRKHKIGTSRWDFGLKMAARLQSIIQCLRVNANDTKRRLFEFFKPYDHLYRVLLSYDETLNFKFLVKPRSWVHLREALEQTLKNLSLIVHFDISKIFTN